MKYISKILVGISVTLIIIGLMIYPTMWCWNYLMPELFELPRIGAEQAFVLNIFASLMFKTTTVSTKS